MLPKKLKENEAGTIGLPIRITVLSIIGFIGFYAILSAIGSAPNPPEPMYAKTNISTFSLPSPESGGDGETNLSLKIKVFDSNNRGIEEANVITWSPDRKKAYSGVTDPNGNVTVKIINPELPPGKAEGYISIKVMRSGYRDFTSNYFLKVIRS
ncbi:MAG: carboxypeptidase-like regulatory domain-containing protein [Methanosarcina sp.]|nr:hypothetical protein BGV40_04175 [Methanosarcina sp. Ant1]